MFLDKLKNLFGPKKKKYVSCPWIEYGLDFDLGVYGSNLKLCCYLSAPGGGNAYLIKDYFGEKINWNKINKLRNKYRKIQQSGKTIPECQGCVFLQEGEWEQSDIVSHVIFDHWTHCNCKCTYCYTEDDKERYNKLNTYSVMPIIKDMLKKKILSPGGAIGFGGGEPTMLQEFEELISVLLENGFDNIRVPSSALKYSPIIEKGIASKQLTVVVSVDSGSGEVYKKIKQVDAYDLVCENLKKYAIAQVEPGFVVSKYIIIPGINDTKEEIDKWLDFNASNNILSIVIDIENSWFEKNRDNSNEHIYSLIEYAGTQSKKMGFVRYDICDRALHMLKERKSNF